MAFLEFLRTVGLYFSSHLKFGHFFFFECFKPTPPSSRNSNYMYIRLMKVVSPFFFNFLFILRFLLESFYFCLQVGSSSLLPYLTSVNPILCIFFHLRHYSFHLCRMLYLYSVILLSSWNMWNIAIKSISLSCLLILTSVLF